MNSDKKQFNSKYDILIISILIISALIAALLAVKNIKISPDSMRFGLVSQQILNGNGIKAPLIRLEDTYIPVNGAVPFLDQTPLFPILLAGLGGLTPDNFWPAQIINLLSHTVISFFSFLLMKNLYNNRVIALVVGILVSFSFPLLRVTHHIWSEPLFIALTVVTIYFLSLSRNPDGSKYSQSLFLASICGSAAILARNAGIALIPIFLWEGVRLIKSKKPLSNYVFALLATTIPLFTAMAFLIRNYLISGTIRGFNQPSPDRSFFDAVTGTIKIIFKQFQLGDLPTILIILFTVIFLLYISINISARKELLKNISSGLGIILFFILSYTALICVTMAKTQPQFEVRYVSPLVPFLYIVTLYIVVFIWKRIESKGFFKLSSVAMILSISMVIFYNSYKSYLNLPEFFYKQYKAYSILNSCAFKWLKEKHPENIIIATNKPYHLSFFGGYSTIILPHRRFDPNIRVPENMKSLLPNRMSELKANALVLFNKIEEQYDGYYLASLFNKRTDIDRFILAHDCPDGVVYYLNK